MTILSGCGQATPEAPYLLSAETIAPGTKGALLPTDIPTVIPSNTSTDIPTDTDAPPTPTFEPTLTATPTETDTATATITFTPSPYISPTRTLRPTRTVTPSASPPTDTPMPCTINWFFYPRPSTCPMTVQQPGAAAYETFENGFMIYFDPGKVIFVAFDKGKQRWAQYTNTWKDGMPDNDPTIVPPASMFQPIRGFGLVWRNKPLVRSRLGWATAEEVAYTAALQIDIDGNRYIAGPRGEVYELSADFKNWTMAS